MEAEVLPTDTPPMPPASAPMQAEAPATMPLEEPVTASGAVQSVELRATPVQSLEP